MITKTAKNIALQLIRTPAVDGLSEAVFSILALYSEGDIISSRFAYDISRNKERAEAILALLHNAAPEKDSFLDTVCELI